MSDPTEKPQLHWSAMEMLSRCGEQFRRRYVENEIIPPGAALAVGIAVHESVERNLRNRLDKGVLLPVAHSADAARDAVHRLFGKGVTLSPEEVSDGIGTVLGRCIDEAVTMAGAHAQVLAPQLRPVHVERTWVLRLPNYPVDLAGKIDIQERATVRDTKTARKSPDDDAAHRSGQLTAYALAVKTLDGTAELPAVAMDHVVLLKSGPKIVTQHSTRALEDAHVFLGRVERAVEAIQKGSFVPARESDWWCSPRWCGYYATCPFVRHGESVFFGASAPMEESNGQG